MTNIEEISKLNPEQLVQFVNGLPEGFGIKGISGITVDGRPVVQHVAKFVSTHGLPLEVVLGFFHERGYAIDWLGYVRDSMADGASLKNIRAKILEAIGTVYEPKQQDQFKEKLELLWYIV